VPKSVVENATSHSQKTKNELQKNEILPNQKTNENLENISEEKTNEKSTKNEKTNVKSENQNIENKMKTSKNEIKCFEKLLEEMDIKVTAEWEDVLPALQNDDRFNIVKNKEERIEIFNNWKKRLFKNQIIKEKNEKREKMEKEKSITTKNFLSKKFDAIDDQNLRNKILKEYTKKMVKNELKAKKRKKIDQMDQLETFFRAKRDFKIDTPWQIALKTAKKQTFCNELNEKDIFKVISELKEDLSLREKAIDGDEQPSDDEGARFRNDFRKLLDEIARADMINTKTKFEEIKDLVTRDDRFVALKEQDFAAEDIFEDYCRNLRVLIRRDKRVFESLMKVFNG
ncbi:PRP40 pre-mRNA processing factor 40, partial [Bonamia ostreae]